MGEGGHGILGAGIGGVGWLARYSGGGGGGLYSGGGIGGGGRGARHLNKKRVKEWLHGL